MTPRSLRTSGFTLVEVLVALVVVAIGMAALLGALGAAADSTTYLRDKTFAQWVALNRVTELRLQGRMPTKGKTSGETEFAGNRWQWEQEVTDLDVPGVVRIDLKVRLAGGPASQSKAWMGNAIGVMGDAVSQVVNPLDTPWTWESPLEGPGGGDGSGNGDGNNNDGSGTGNGSGDGNGDSPPPSNTGQQE